MAPNTWILILLLLQVVVTSAHECTEIDVEVNDYNNDYLLLPNEGFRQKYHPTTEVINGEKVYESEDATFEIYYSSTSSSIWSLRNKNTGVNLVRIVGSTPFDGLEATYECKLYINEFMIKLEWANCGSLVIIECVEFDTDKTLAPISPASIYVRSLMERIVGFDHSQDTYKPIVDADGEYLGSLIGDLFFLSQYEFLVADGLNDKILRYDVNGTLIKAIDFNNPLAFLALDDGEILVLSSIDTEDFSGALLTIMNKDLEFVTISIELWYDDENDVVSPDARSICFGRNDDEILVLDKKYGDVIRVDLIELRKAISRGDASFMGEYILSIYYARTEVKYVDLKDFNVRDIAFVRKTGQIFIADAETTNTFVDARIYSCSISSGSSSCQVWYRESTESFTHPSRITVDEEKELVYVLFSVSSQVGVFTFDGGLPIAEIGSKRGDLPTPTQMAIRPGFFAPLSSIVDEATEFVAGLRILLPLDLRDDNNNAIITGDLPDPSRFSCYAVGEITTESGERLEITSEQKVVSNDENGLSAEISITTSGTFSLHVKEGSGGMVKNSFKNSPLALTIVSAASSPYHSTAQVPQTLGEGVSTFDFIVFTRDEFGNPSFDSADTTLEYYWADNKETTTKIVDRAATVKKDTEGTSLLHITLNNDDIYGSPFGVTSEKQLLKMPGLATLSLFIAIILGGGQLMFFVAIIVFFRDKNFVKRQSILNNAASVYSGADWFSDVYFVSEAFRRGYSNYGKSGAAILLVNMAVNLAVIGRIIFVEKSRDNVNHKVWKTSGFYVGVVEFLALNQVGLIKYLPWDRTPYSGYGSRHMFALCSLVPLLTENIPQLILQVLFAFEEAKMEAYQVISMTTTGLAIVLSIFTKVPLIFLVNNSTAASISPISTRRESVDDHDEITTEVLTAKLEEMTEKYKQIQQQLNEYKEGNSFDVMKVLTSARAKKMNN